MAKLNQKLTTLAQALETLKKGIELFNKYSEKFNLEQTEQNEELFKGMRDSMVQRFEYCTDLFWKVLKLYLEEIEKVNLVSISPKGVIRESVRIKTITEDEGKSCIDMVMNRNQTSHLYHEETANIIANKISGFYKLLDTLATRLQQKTS